MRLRKEMVDFFSNYISQIYPNVKVYLFGSRVDDSAKGGDIDILLLHPTKLDRSETLKIKIEFWKRFGEQKIDLLSYSLDEKDNFKTHAIETGILLYG